MRLTEDLALDTQLLRTLVAVYEEGSVSQAAIRLGVNQSTLSHRLERLRAVIGDPLFVRAGRGISPTPRADEIIADALAALESIRRIIEPGSFDPAKINRRFIVAATDYERAVFLLGARKRLLGLAPNARLQFIWDPYDSGAQLRAGNIDIVVAPTLSDGEPAAHYGGDIKGANLFDDDLVSYFDANSMEPPDSIEKYIEAKHVRVIVSLTTVSLVDKVMRPLGLVRHVSTDMPSISELPRLMMGESLVATLPLRLKNSIMRDFSYCKLPFDMPRLTYRMYWHERTAPSPDHEWLRAHLITTARDGART